MRVTAKQAAEILGISSRAVRLRLQKGTLAGFQAVDDATGVATWMVELPDAEGEGVPPQEAIDPPSDHYLPEGESMGVPSLDQIGNIVITFQHAMERLHRENLELAGRCGYYQSRCQELESRVALLEAPKPEPADIQEAVRRPWWRFW